jgi:hypothetical protein
MSFWKVHLGVWSKVEESDFPKWVEESHCYERCILTYGNPEDGMCVYTSLDDTWIFEFSTYAEPLLVLTDHPSDYIDIKSKMATISIGEHLNDGGGRVLDFLSNILIELPRAVEDEKVHRRRVREAYAEKKAAERRRKAE